MPPSLAALKSMLLDLLFPQRCIGCGIEGSFLCPSCLELLPRLNSPYCSRCGIPVAQGALCPACLRWPLSIDGIRSLFLFEGVAREAIHLLKYKNLKAIAGPLGQLLAERLRSDPLPVDAIIAVPLHPKHLRQRGYNQALLLAQQLSQVCQLPLLEGSLVRRRNTPAQARTASAAQRRDNVQGAFVCRDQSVQGKGVLLIDDVCTTGATLDACATAIKAAGAASVWGLTVAREVQH